MFKSLVRYFIAFVSFYTGTTIFAESKLKKSLTILCYHRVLPKHEKNSSLFPDLIVTPETFNLHCRVLARHYDIYPLSEACDLMRKGYKSKRPLAIITFDDGYCDNIEYASPILASHGLRATFFIITGLIGKEEYPWYDKLSHAADVCISKGILKENLENSLLHYLFENGNNPTLKEIVQAAKKISSEDRSLLITKLLKASGSEIPDSELNRIMSDSEIKSLQKKGHEIGSHTVSHEILSLLNENQLTYEVTKSKEILESLLKSSVRSFCYPNGDYNSTTLEAVKAAKYSYACTTFKGKNSILFSPFELKRWFLHEDRLLSPVGKPSSLLFRLEISGLADRFFRRKPIK
ncbi:polysaccharide deacetylase family protein [Spirochaeta isovalerica]|uniref:Peptidoglycan/xylan/chitin deacetylase (PgdA/CDA1 family) n=1 Tax=Spirochaeta isovalerica TaxID=150 RepID=A0A841R890_9SPIO|nr:polysaccharide deacetylase family protein [Spirochaeta isovalerica]MBB6479250.1 peptidoglycan/xylan/chitin deacetylase (PgdA/CDA1 family) [Spirochaeta isovalerica]